MKILIASSELSPLTPPDILGDGVAALATALMNLRHDVRLLIPGYPDTMNNALPLDSVGKLVLPGCDSPARLLKGRFGEAQIPLYLLDAPGLLDRRGGLYHDGKGQPWRDNAQRFAVFGRAVAALGLGHAGVNWQPEVVHCHNWQTAITPALLSLDWNRPATVFSLHQTEQQIGFAAEQAQNVDLPEPLWPEGSLKHQQQLSLLKGGIAFADALTSTSPDFNRRLLSGQSGGPALATWLNARRDRLSGIHNGIDLQRWDPSNDTFIAQRYDQRTFDLKLNNRLALQKSANLAQLNRAMLLGYFGPLTTDDGGDLLIEILPRLLANPALQLLVAGDGDPTLMQVLSRARDNNPGRIAIVEQVDESLNHRMMAGCDALLLPQRVELPRMYQLKAMRYGTPPIIASTAGLLGVVQPATPANLMKQQATGFVFQPTGADALWTAIEQAAGVFRRPGPWWEKLAVTCMQSHIGWADTAQEYLEVYRYAIDNPAPAHPALRSG